MTCPIKAATIAHTFKNGYVQVAINADAAEILNIEMVSCTFGSYQGAVDFIADLQRDLDDAYADAC